MSAVITFAAYLLGVLVLGVALARRTRSYEDFIIGGRRFGTSVSSLSLISSYASGYTYTAAPGLGYTQGYGSLWYASGDGLATALSFGVIGRRLRKFSEALDAISLPEFYEKRFDSRLLRIVTSTVILVTVTMYLVAQWVASGTVAQTILGTSHLVGMLVGALVVGAYTLLGGYVAVVYTDAVQMVVMFVGTQLLFWIALAKVGGFAQLNDRLANIDPDLVTPWGPDQMYLGFFLMIGPVLLITLGGFGLPHMTVRHLSLNQPSTARKAMMMTAVIVVAFSFIYYMTGLLALTVLGPGLADPEQAGVALWQNVLPPVLAGLLASAAVASIQSTASSFLILLVTTIGHDIFYRFIPRRMSDRSRTRVARVLVAVLTIGTFLVAINPPALVFQIVIFAFGILGLAFGVPNIFVLYWRRTTKVGVLVSMLSSLAVYLGLSLTNQTQLGPLTPFLAGLLVAIASIVFTSLLTTPPPDPHQLFVRVASEGTVVSETERGESACLRRDLGLAAEALGAIGQPMRRSSRGRPRTSGI